MDTLLNSFEKLTVDLKNEKINTKMELLKKIIKSNKYVRECVSNKERNVHSISYLIKRDLSQSDCIKIGNGIEKIFTDIILMKNPHLENIKVKNSVGVKERDHLFKDATTIYYAEVKSNLNLDTEKKKSTSDKCADIQEILKKEYPDHIIKMYLFGARYYETELIPNEITKKYKSINKNVIGVNNYLKELNVDLQFSSEEEYSEFLNELANEMFS